MLGEQACYGVGAKTIFVKLAKALVVECLVSVTKEVEARRRSRRHPRMVAIQTASASRGDAPQDGSMILPFR